MIFPARNLQAVRGWTIAMWDCCRGNQKKMGHSFRKYQKLRKDTHCIYFLLNFFWMTWLQWMKSMNFRFSQGCHKMRGYWYYYVVYSSMSIMCEVYVNTSDPRSSVDQHGPLVCLYQLCVRCAPQLQKRKKIEQFLLYLKQNPYSRSWGNFHICIYIYIYLQICI